MQNTEPAASLHVANLPQARGLKFPEYGSYTAESTETSHVNGLFKAVTWRPPELVPTRRASLNCQWNYLTFRETFNGKFILNILAGKKARLLTRLH